MSNNRRNSKNTALSIIAVILALFFVASVVIGCGEYLGYFDNDDDEPDQTVTDPEGLEYTLSSDGTEYSVSGIGNYTAADIVIPEEYDGIAVTSIDDYAFYKSTTIESVYIPESVTSIGKCAFYRSSLQDITFEETRTWYCQPIESYRPSWSYYSIGVDVTHELTVHYITDMYAEYYWISYYDTYGSTLNGVLFTLFDTFYYDSDGFYLINNKGEKSQIYTADEAADYWGITILLIDQKNYYVPKCSESLYRHFVILADDGYAYEVYRYHGDHTFEDGICKYCCISEETGEYEHTYTETVVASTCTEDGYTLHRCSNCYYSYRTDYVDATGHNYVDGVCTVCGASE